ncbi:hypothetical protein TraAM80_09593 [Trypanosoma rangeli]|uniref:Trans-sialidase n=1 Tax=Trypanosoma rangeli TaxID=5698 RepID=A0A422MUJ9_TRYRA|nr:uncharacterized protein TraAM80_09593 [Trypanosoma rangeli]RNE96867.1 hypothetical protein TraAM80_09593 [Trypanosoma rangeli]|eukprot:RNE96867.1 hypothetical protein TraAM80_09593 [Trypanosoma rangeli]
MRTLACAGGVPQNSGPAGNNTTGGAASRVSQEKGGVSPSDASTPAVAVQDENRTGVTVAGGGANKGRGGSAVEDASANPTAVKTAASGLVVHNNISNGSGSPLRKGSVKDSAACGCRLLPPLLLLGLWAFV